MKYSNHDKINLDLLLTELIEVLRLKLFILVNFANSFDIYLYLSRILCFSSLFFMFMIQLTFFVFLLTQHVTFGPVHSIFVINFMFSSKSYSSSLNTSFILNLGFEDEYDLEVFDFIKDLARIGFGLTSGNFLVSILGPVVYILYINFIFYSNNLSLDSA